MIDYINISNNSVFINFALCNMFCPSCHKRYIFVNTNIKNILEVINNKDIKNIYFCGGEPIINSEFGELLDKLYCDYSIYITTNGIELDKIKTFISTYPEIRWILKVKIIDKDIQNKIGYDIKKLKETVDFFNYNNIKFDCYIDLEYAILIDNLYEYNFLLDSCDKIYARSMSICNILKNRKNEIICLSDNLNGIHHIY